MAAVYVGIACVVSVCVIGSMVGVSVPCTVFSLSIATEVCFVGRVAVRANCSVFRGGVWEYGVVCWVRLPV